MDCPFPSWIICDVRLIKYNRQQRQYIIQQRMIEILNLATSPSNPKPQDPSCLSKQQHFNDLLHRLRQRNTNNEIHIKRYIKKNRKKYGMFIFSHAICAQYRNKQERNEVKHLNHTLYAFDRGSTQSRQSFEAIKEEDERNQLKETNISEQEGSRTVLEHNKTNPTLRIKQHTHKSSKKLTQPNPQIHLKQNKCAKELTRYLRSFFLNKIVEKSRFKEKQRELQLKSNARSLRKGRAKAQTQKPICCKVKVKSLIFGNLEECSGSKRYQENVRVHTESHDNRYSGLQKKKQVPGILPTIASNTSMKNRRCLQNYLRFHQQKVNRQRFQCFKITRIPIENQLTSGTQILNRKTILTNLNTLQMRKNLKN